MNSPAYLADGLDSLRDADETEQPDEEVDEGNVPLEEVGVLYPLTPVQHPMAAIEHMTSFQDNNITHDIVP